jgi:hypothetical protein
MGGRRQLADKPPSGTEAYAEMQPDGKIVAIGLSRD